MRDSGQSSPSTAVHIPPKFKVESKDSKQQPKPRSSFGAYLDAERDGYDLFFDPPEDLELIISHGSVDLAEAIHRMRSSRMEGWRTRDLERQGQAVDERAREEGYLVTFQGDKDPLDPRNAPLWKRIMVSLTIAINAFLISAFASAYLFVAPDIEEAFQACSLLVITGFVVYVVTWGFGPLLWAPLSSTIGRKPVYLFGTISWTLFNIGCARASNLNTVIVCRMFSGLLGSSCLCNGSGSNSEMWTGHARTRTVTLYSCTVFLGPVCGPLVGGAIQTYAPMMSKNGGWRWLFYAGIIAGVVITVMHALVMETNHNILLRRRVKKLNKELEKTRKEQETQQRDNSGSTNQRTKDAELLWYTTEPDLHQAPLVGKITRVTLSALRMIVEEPIILFISTWQTLVMAILYLFFEAYVVVFQEGHGFDAFQTGLCFLGVGSGMFLTCAWGVTFEIKLFEKRVAKEGSKAKPEMRVPLGLAGSILTVVGLFWFGYTSYPSVHWIVPILGSAVYGAGAISVMLSTFSYIVDCYLILAAPAFAGVGLIRSIVTSILPLVGNPFFTNLGPRNATLILALLAVVQILTPLAAMRYGENLRSRSRFSLK